MHKPRVDVEISSSSSSSFSHTFIVVFLTEFTSPYTRNSSLLSGTSNHFRHAEGMESA